MIDPQGLERGQLAEVKGGVEPDDCSRFMQFAAGRGRRALGNLIAQVDGQLPASRVPHDHH